ncbi:MAG: DoxX family protein [Acidobacteria bacterium]|nr:DoxX family protein [Acidobacteriota bacterium]
MSIRKIFAAREYATMSDLALLLLRFVGGAAFMMHGWSKIQHPFSWMGPDSFVSPFFQALAALSEFGGGLAWILGLLTPLASLGVLSTMSVATWFHAIKRGDPFVSTGGEASFELAAIYFCVAFLLIALGPGTLSLDRIVFGTKRAGG